MPAMLTESGRYMRRIYPGWKAWCFTCHATIAEGSDYKQVWDEFRTKVVVLALRSHQFWVCSTCLSSYERGNLHTVRLNSFNAHLKRKKTRPSNIV